MSNVSNKKNNNIVRKLITIGIYNAIMIIVFSCIAVTIGYFPLVIIILPAIMALVGGPIFMLMLAKAQMKGIFTISGFLLGLVLINMAPAGSMFIGCLLGGILGDITWSILRGKKNISEILGFCCNMAGLAIGEYFPFVYMQQSYIQMYASKDNLEIAKIVMGFMNLHLMIIMTIVTIIAGFLGGLWGKKLLKKHFEKAGIVGGL